MFLKRQDPYLLVVSMTGVKLGDQLLQIGCAHGGTAWRGRRQGRVVGARGRDRAGRIVGGARAKRRGAGRRAGRGRDRAADEAAARRRRSSTSPSSTTRAACSARCAPRIASTSIRELVRVLRPGGRVMVIGAAPRGGLGALLTRRRAARPSPRRAKHWWRSKRTGSSRCACSPSEKGSVFVEGVKPRAGT